MFSMMRQNKAGPPEGSVRQMSNKGVLLIEALLTILVMTVSLTVIMGSQVASLQARVLTTEYTQAMWAAENEIFAIFTSGPSERTAPKEGLTDNDYTVTSSMEKGSGDDRWEKVMVEVRWGAGKQHRSLSVATGVLNPKSGG